MKRIRLIAVLVLGLAAILPAKTLVSLCAGYPDVAFGQNGYLVVYLYAFFQPNFAVRAARVDIHGNVPPPEDRLNLEPRVDGVWYGMPAVAAMGSSYLAVWIEESTATPTVYKVVGRVVYPDTMSDLVMFARGSEGYGLRKPDVASNGSTFLLVWEDMQQHGVFGRRVTSDGQFLEADAWRISPDYPPYDARSPTVASDGDSYLVAWHRWNQGQGWEISGSIVDPGGTVHDPFTIAESTPGQDLRDPDVTFGGEASSYMVIWKIWSPNHQVLVGARAYAAAGNPLGEQFLVVDSSAVAQEYLSYPKVAASPVDYLVSWVDWRLPLWDLWCQRAYSRDGTAGGPSGIPVGPRDTVCVDDEADQWSVALAYGGAHFLAAWDETQVGFNIGEVYVDTISPWQRHFITQKAEATAYNQGRNLALDPVTGWLHAVYWSGQSGADTVYYTCSKDAGLNWAPYEVVSADAAFPCVVCENQELWICYQKPSSRTIVCKFRLGSGDWEEYSAYPQPSGTPGPPSMSRIYIYGPQNLPGVYVVFSVTNGEATTIEFRAVRYAAGVVYSRTLDQASSPDSCLTPSVATTPGDIAHVAWKKVGMYQGQPRKMAAYCRRYYGGNWSIPTGMSVLDPLLPCEPAFNPCIDAYGGALVGVWDALGVDPKHEIWRRQKDAWLPGFPPGNVPANRSNSAEAHSAFPQNSTSAFIAWQENNGVTPNGGIYAYREGQPAPFEIFGDISTSNHADIVAELPSPGGDSITVSTLWTHALGLGVGWEVRFQAQVLQQNDGSADYSYYDCAVGDSVRSYYCQARDGYAKWRDFSVDFARERLRYRIPFLNPNCTYLLRAVLFHASRDTWVNDFDMEGRRVARVAYHPLQPETVWATIPRELYREDCEVTLDVSRVAGDYAALAGLTLYQRLPYRGGGREGGEMMTSATTPLVVEGLRSVGPSPFRTRTYISYSVLSECQAAVRVYDVQGRLVRRLVSGLHHPGRYSAAWDGCDDGGRHLPAGTYYLRLGLPSASSCRAVVLAR